MNASTISLLLVVVVAATLIEAWPGPLVVCRGGKPQDCICTSEFNPQCGTNGKTYSNPCVVQCDQECDRSIKIDHEGPCQKTPSRAPPLTVCRGGKPQECICTAEFNPQCGTNGQTYSNPCVFRCDQSCDRSLKIAHEGAC
ncbi:unnamed protein product [Allacma fusca]|uniref:Kazal-like domain-containing protein n=1 Tax=Allacma fusca TaxID=39272 RepID=A0A8J2P466_9HEXA|nr:unnamed protein product [Allacma fusca]